MTDELTRVRRHWPRLLLAVAVAFQTVALCADAAADAEVRVTRWLALGPVAVPLPAFHDESDENTSAGMLSYQHLNRRSLRPEEGAAARLVDGETRWSALEADTGGVVLPTNTTSTSVAYLAAYVSVPRWTKLELKSSGTGPFEVWVGGKSVAKRAKGGEGSETGTAKLAQGKHLVLVKAVFVPGDTLAAWRFDLCAGAGDEALAAPSFSTDPTRGLTINDVIEGPAVDQVQVSPDGAFVALSMWECRAPEGTRDTWVEVRLVRDGALVRMIRDTEGSSWAWTPRGHRLSYVTRGDDKASLHVLDLDEGRVETIVEEVEHFGSYWWSPDESFVVYSVNREDEENEKGVKRLRGLSDRRRGDRDRSSLFVSSVPAGMARRITAGEHTTFVHDIHPDGRQILIGRSYEDLSERDYSVDELILLDLDDQSTELLHRSRWMERASWSPDGESILVTGGPSCFGTLGHDVAEGVIPNEYDTQAYVLDPRTKEATPITKDFDPSLVSASWPRPGRHIYLVASEGEYVRLFRYDVGKRSFKRIDMECDVIGGFDAARDAPVGVATGTSVNRPQRVYSVDLRSGRARTMFDPAGERFSRVEIGEVKDFDFTAGSGKTIVGRVHLPPDFDPARQWPGIVYYYGGTRPVDRTFGGRYPKNLWSAHGYVVYVLQPSGATGFGQSYSALHVNEWGKIVADEVLEGARAFLDAHPFVDRDRVGCIGASFGGFLTQLLVTKTDMFAAAVSHAGVSSISSYWGEGYWGYGYNSISAANSFPWNRRDIYIDQSPLFAADKVTTPLLLLHGAADTNVPRGESEQMYTALKLLGKEVEYIRVVGQDHWILDYKKRIVWNDAIVSWFDRWLKDEPDWWNDMYADPGGADDEEAGSGSRGE